MKTIEVWADVVCPWCYIGKRNLELAVEKLGAEVEIIPRAFQLDPSPQGVAPTVEMLMSKYGQSREGVAQMMARVEGVAKSIGLEYHLDKTLSGNTFDVHRLLKAAGNEHAFARAYRWYFTEGRSFFDRESLLALAQEIGVNDAASLLDSDRHADLVRADIEKAHAIGVRGVPFFVIDARVAVEGAQPAEMLLKALQA
jgi:predicted DsbA family dithiol-disulfide isomerase